MKVKELLRAKELRKRGYSLGEISRELKVSKSSVSIWVKDVSLDNKAKEILNTKIHKSQREFIKRNLLNGRIKQEEAKLFAKLILKDILIDSKIKMLLCAMIFWCEGTKDNSVSFMNSDPELLKTFIKLFRESFELNEGKFRVCVHLHTYHDRDKQLIFWSKMLKIPLNQFIKPFIKLNEGIHIRDNYQGCVSVRYHDSSIARKLKAIAKEFMKGD